jgi:death-on-curing protein
MNEPAWVSREVVLAIQAALLERFGGLCGLRDEGLLESALHRPRQLFAYGEPTLFELAAAYAAGIVRNHPFLDGNKRAGFMAAYVFLEANGMTIAASEETVVLRTLGLAAGEVDEAAYAAWLAESCRGVG